MTAPLPLGLGSRSGAPVTQGGIGIARKGFRPFFLLAGLFGAFAIPHWLLLLSGWLAAPGAMPPMLWHGHEMLFGYAAAVIAGFVLTATENWTDRATVKGWPLLALALLWLAGRVFMLLPGAPLVGRIVDVAFLPAVAVVIARPIVLSRNRRNYAIVAMLLVFAGCNLVTHLDVLGYLPGRGRSGLMLAKNIVTLLMLVVGARIIPSFTRNATRDSSIQSYPTLNKLTVASFLLYLVADVALGAGPLTAVLAGMSGALVIARARHWGARPSLGNPMLWVMHLGHTWIGIGLLLGALSAFLPVLAASSLHALTAGAAGTLTLGMMCRVTLGHTGRFIATNRSTTLAFVAITVAAVLRVAAPLLPAHYLAILAVAGSAWSLAFVLFVVSYAPALVRPRVDGKPG